MVIENNTQTSLFDLLYCNEEKWEEEEEEKTNEQESHITFNLVLSEQDLIWDDEELQSLLLKEKQTFLAPNKTRFSYSMLRKEAIDWILKNNAHFGFSALTAILAVNYLDRCLSTLNFEKDNNNQPWIMQLASVTCLSLAAKVEETHVPLLLQLQVGVTEYVFEPKNIQRMELLVLSALNWRMNPVTPISFIDHIIRRLGFESYIQCDFLHSCENILLSVISDSRFVLYLPSVLATATLLHVFHQCNAIDYENQILTLLKTSKEEVKDCYEFISESGLCSKKLNLKRKLSEIEKSSSGVTNAILTCDSSNGSWSISSSPQKQPIHKISRVEEQNMKLHSMSKGFVDGID